MNKVAFLFPGQGSQAIGLLAELGRQSDLVKNLFDEASQAVGSNLWKIAQEGPEDRLNQTEITQPVMLAAGVACWRVWKEAGGFDPDLMAGHSLGEYSALVAAGTLDFGDAVDLVVERARRMQAATPSGTGAMAAILGLDDYTLNQVCEQAAEGEVVSCANFNSPGQVVIAGNKTAVDRACALAQEAGARRAIPLAVSVPSHCALMRPAAMDFSVALANTEFSLGGIPVLQNVDLKAHTTDESIRMALEKQLSQPVRWAETIKEFESRGVSRFVECGPGKVLLGLNRRIIRDAEVAVINNLDTMKKIMTEWG
jgi:[acyl-carrier-protein] S-malonyltransferase